MAAQKTYFFHVHGMHCASCVMLIESALSEVSEVSHVKASIATFSVEITADFGDKTPEHVALDLSEVIKSHGYTLSFERMVHRIQWLDFRFAFPIAAGFILLFIFLQKLGIVNLVTTSEVSYGVAFVLGLIASVSTCMAIVGGLVLSVSASFAKEGDRMRPQIFFHAGRLISFFLLGGLLGALGTFFQFGILSNFIFGILVGLIMLILGLNLLDVFPWMKRWQPVMPGFISRRVHQLKNLNHTVTPFLIGVATFFLPCGFTQSVQIYTLTTGSFWSGAMTMFLFALGTFPVLAILSFSSLGIHGKMQSSIFFKTAGLIVIFFGFLNMYNSFVIFGLLPPIFNF